MDDLAVSVVRRFMARTVTSPVAKKWADVYERALKKLSPERVDVKLVYGGNVRTYVDTMIDGNPVPQIVVEEDKISVRFSRLKWVRIDSGPGAKFIKAPTKMAQYVIATYA